ncbi:hypothetical protein ACSQ67_014191 [Phaseolus vulgaris]
MEASSTTGSNSGDAFVSSPFGYQLFFQADLCLILCSAPGSQSIGPSAITYSFNNESEGKQDFSNATIKIERCSCASTSRVRVGVIAGSFNNKGNGIQNFSNATIIIIGNCCGSLGLHGIIFYCFFLRVLVALLLIPTRDQHLHLRILDSTRSKVEVNSPSRGHSTRQ